MTVSKNTEKALNPEILQGGAPRKDQEEKRIKGLYDKLMKSEYETSFNNSFKTKS